MRQQEQQSKESPRFADAEKYFYFNSGKKSNYNKQQQLMQESLTVNEAICRQLLSSDLAPEAVEASLLAKGIHADNMAAYLGTIKRMRYAKRRNTGFMFMAAGAFLGFLSCVLTITHALPNMFEFIFYGLTTLAVCLVVLGLYYVFE